MRTSRVDFGPRWVLSASWVSKDLPSSAVEVVTDLVGGDVADLGVGVDIAADQSGAGDPVAGKVTHFIGWSPC